MSNELAVTFEEFKRRTKFAIDQHRTGTLTEAEFDQLVKMVDLSYLNISDWDAPTVSTQAQIVLTLFQREMGLLPQPPYEAFRKLRQFAADMQAIAEAA